MRDPWTEPAAGDVIRARTGTVRKVVEVLYTDCPNQRIVFTHERNGAAPVKRREWSYAWRNWCARNAIRDEN